MDASTDTKPASATGAQTRLGPLAGIRVLDMATMIAAPLVASILGDYGAEVIKLELPGVGDTGRKMGATRDGVGLYWKTLGRNKRSVAVDLRQPEAQALLLRWLPTFDVVIENFRPGTLDRYNLTEERIRSVHPGIIILRVTAFGQDGPYKDRQGFGTLAETMSGVASVLLKGLRGHSSTRPALTSFPLGDVSAGMMGVNGVLAALLHRERTGRGETIDLAIYEVLLKFMEIELLRYDPEDASLVNEETRRPDSSPRGVFRCSDGVWISLSGSTQPTAMRVLNLVGGEALAHDPRFLTNDLRVKHVDELDELLETWCAARESVDAIGLLSGAGCAVGPVETVETLLVNPQVIARQAILDVPDEDLGSLRMTNVIPRFQSFERRPPVPAPTIVGAHTAMVLERDLGLDRQELQRLRDAGAIG